MPATRSSLLIPLLLASLFAPALFAETFQDCDICPLMTTIPAGSFTLGSPATETGREDDEGPQLQVTISQPLAVGVYEISFNEWQACVDAGGCQHKPGDLGWGRGKHPVLNVNWQDTQQYLNWLNSQTDQPGYRLPTEAEWEYFARANSDAVFHLGNSLNSQQANFDAARPYPPEPSDEPLDSLRRRATVPVGSYPANAFGIYDVLGNVSEWVADCYAADAYSTHNNYPAAVSGPDDCRRVIRGGTSHYSATYSRSANRTGIKASSRNLDIGFRVVKQLTP